MNTIDLELDGNAGITSLNYNRFLIQSLALRGGFGVAAGRDGDLYMVVPTGIVMLEYVNPLWSNELYLQSGVGIVALLAPTFRTTWTFSNAEHHTDVAPTLSLGLRIFPQHYGFSFGFTIVAWPTYHPISAGISIGESF